MMMGLKKFKIIWGKITSENNIRRTILTEQVINELENGKNINFLKDKIDIYYSNKEKYTFGRSKDNEKILSEIVDLYFQNYFSYWTGEGNYVNTLKFFIDNFSNFRMVEREFVHLFTGRTPICIEIDNDFLWFFFLCCECLSHRHPADLGKAKTLNQK